MLPKIDRKSNSNSQNVYPKLKTNTSDKENNISRLKKLREFLENKSIEIDKKQHLSQPAKLIRQYLKHHNPIDQFTIILKNKSQYKRDISQKEKDSSPVGNNVEMVDGKEGTSECGEDKTEGTGGFLFYETKGSGFIEFLQMQDSMRQDEGDNCGNRKLKK